ncbi:hypothetical protein L1049_016938 [Liquidambar formosana]|uniref:Cysteine-rich receptor-like protein kinase 2 n=1 Tax=Liquidambar formosana TaxID=63359 RepID=A0AAP0S0A4_LIQFO
MVSFLLALTLLATISSTTVTTLTSAANDTFTTVLNRTCSPISAANPQTFDTTFVDAMEIVLRQVTDTGFGMAVAGATTADQVYGLGQCLSYLTNTDCRLCYAESRVKLPLCLPTISARIYLNGCFLRYAQYNFSQESVGSLDSSVCGSSGNVSDTANFRQITNGLIQNLTSSAYQTADFYQVGNATISSGERVYGVAQCWKSLNQSGCRECMESAANRTVGCLPGTEGAALNTGCFVRYSLRPFYVNTPTSGSGSSSVSLGGRVGIALASIFAAILIAAAIIIWRRRRYPGYDDYENASGSSEILKKISESNLSFSYEDLKNATNNFDSGNKIGQGGYGTVYKGILADGREIAVKRLFVNSTQWLDQFFNEVNLISRVQHKNLVKLYGCSVDGPESLLVYEYLCNTSLDQFLFDSFRKRALDWGRRFSILVGSAEGLAYLHKASEVRIIHRDVKASNVLLDDRYRPKIADFGLARYFAEGQSHLSTGVAGTLGYMAPEYVVHGQLTEKADVYSYGILVLEVITGRKNTTSISTSTEGHSLTAQVWRHFTSNSVIEMLDPSLEGQCSVEQVLKVFHVGLLCTQASPNLRPPMWKVVEMLISEGRDLPLPTQPPFINIRGAEPRSSGSETSGIASSSSSKQPTSLNQLSVSIMEGR